MTSQQFTLLGMDKQLLEIYALAVCFVSVVCLSIFTGILLYSLVELSFPETMNSSGGYYPPSLAAPSITMPGHLVQKSSVNQTIARSETRLKQIEEEKKQFQNHQAEFMRVESIKSIVRSMIISLIASLVFMFHWRIAKQARSVP